MADIKIQPSVDDAHILVVDDDPGVREMLEEYLQDRGYRVTAAENGQSMLNSFEEGGIDLIVLDLNLPDNDGLGLARSLRERSYIPIIMVTGQGDEIDRIIGLEMGADDYVAKPFSPRELLARIKAVLRRVRLPSETATEETALGQSNGFRDDSLTRVTFANWILNLDSRQLLSPDQREVSLTNGEFSLLAAFVSRPGRVLSRLQLLEMSRIHDDEVYDRSIDVQILRLRRKLEDNPKDPQIIKTERGAGYIFMAPVEKL